MCLFTFFIFHLRDEAADLDVRAGLGALMVKPKYSRRFEFGFFDAVISVEYSVRPFVASRGRAVAAARGSCSVPCSGKPFMRIRRSARQDLTFKPFEKMLSELHRSAKFNTRGSSSSNDPS